MENNKRRCSYVVQSLRSAHKTGEGVLPPRKKNVLQDICLGDEGRGGEARCDIRGVVVHSWSTRRRKHQRKYLDRSAIPNDESSLEMSCRTHRRKRRAQQLSYVSYRRALQFNTVYTTYRFYTLFFIRLQRAIE